MPDQVNENSRLDDRGLIDDQTTNNDQDFQVEVAGEARLGSELRNMESVNGSDSEASNPEVSSESVSSTVPDSQTCSIAQAIIGSVDSSDEFSISIATTSSYEEEIDIIDEEEISTSTDSAAERAAILQDLMNCHRNYRQLNEEPYHEIAAIIDYSMQSDGTCWYRIRWEGFRADSDSWVHSTVLNCPRRLAHYFYLRRLYQIQPMDIYESDSSD